MDHTPVENLRAHFAPRFWLHSASAARTRTDESGSHNSRPGRYRKGIA